MSDELKAKYSTKLWCDLTTDIERAEFIECGRADETGIIAPCMTAELSAAFRSRAAVKERGEDTTRLDEYKAWADKATTQLCGDEPLDRSQLIKEWEAIEPENAEDDSLQQQPEETR